MPYRILKVLAWILGTLVFLGILVSGFAFGGSAIGVPLILFIVIVAGWFVYVFFRYRFVRQEEIVQVLSAAAEAKLPLAPALRAYVRDRPMESQWGWWDVTLMFAFPPGYWLAHQRHVFERRAGDIADLLEAGHSLPEALREVRGAAHYDVTVAATVGEEIGQLPESLRRADRERLVGVWLEVVPRLAYPLALMFFILGITTFFMMQIMPRLRKIFHDFNYELPPITSALIDVWNGTQDWHWIIAAVLAGLAVLLAILIASPTVRWYLPICGRVYRWDVQGLILRMLSLLVEAGRTLPESLGLLADNSDFPAIVQVRLSAARVRINRGEPLAESLHGAGLLPGSMIPLLHSAERANTLPWALRELGEMLAGRANRVVRRVSLIVAPALVLVVGSVVAFIVLAMFMPLIDLLTRLSP
jgi:type II secretory pathway component PulF